MPLWIVMSACSYATAACELLSEAYQGDLVPIEALVTLVCIALIAVYEAFSR